tara:strand:+ start:368 stop:520 length:153 start_codon:yes stop_codon:yes gene_type:complete
MANIKTITEEITEINVDLKDSMINGDYWEVVKVLEKIIEKLDEVIEKVNE